MIGWRLGLDLDSRSLSVISVVLERDGRLTKGTYFGHFANTGGWHPSIFPLKLLTGGI